MFEAIECHKCHGLAGRADGPSRPELKDDWGNPIAPANLTKRWTFRGGPGRTDIAMRLAGGVLGTPMPTFLDSVEKPEDIWHLTNYILSLGPEKPNYSTLVTVNGVTGAIPDDPNAEYWTKIAPNNIPLMGQVIIDPRNFNPAIDLLLVRSVYNEKEIAFHLTWDDPTGNGVYIDGRLEVYDTPFFAQYMQNLGNMAGWERDAADIASTVPAPSPVSRPSQT